MAIKWQLRYGDRITITITVQVLSNFSMGRSAKNMRWYRHRRLYGRLKNRKPGEKWEVLNVNGSEASEEQVLVCSYRGLIGDYVDRSLVNFFNLLSRLWDHGEIWHTCSSSLETDREIDTLFKLGTTLCVPCLHQKMRCIRTLHH